MFNLYGKKGKPTRTKPLQDLIPLMTPSQLLADNKRQSLLHKMQEACGLEKSRFDSLCLFLIHHFTNYCQNLPETANNYYALPGGLLDHALNRTEAALNLMRHFILQEEGAELSEEQKLWLYALFSAAILQGIGKLQLDYKIDLYDANGHQLKEWNPLLGSLASVGKFYDYAFQKDHVDDLRCRLNLLLARQLMPPSGFGWIASNPQVLAIWLALLNEDWQSAGTLGAILIRSDALAIQRYLNEFIAGHAAGRGGRGNRITTFIDNNALSLVDKEQLVGMEFIQWLNQALASGKVMINKSPLLMVPGGMLMCDDMYKLFIRENPDFKNWQIVQQSFLSLGFHSEGTDGSAVSRFEATETQQMQSGVVFADYALVLPDSLHVHNLQTGKDAPMSALEFVHKAQFNSNFTQPNATNISALTHLNAAGQWQQVTQSPLATGKAFGG